MNIIDWLDNQGKESCQEARIWLSTFPKNATMNDAWKLCQNSDWMIWAAGRSNIADDDKVWRQLAFALARRTKASIDSNQTCWDVMLPEARKCIEVAEAFESGTATAEERRAAKDAIIFLMNTFTPEQFNTLVHFSSKAAIWCATKINKRMAANYAALDATWAWDGGAEKAQASQTIIIREFIKDPW